jgi:hypothetical protein
MARTRQYLTSKHCNIAQKTPKARSKLAASAPWFLRFSAKEAIYAKPKLTLLLTKSSKTAFWQHCVAIRTDLYTVKLLVRRPHHAVGPDEQIRQQPSSR